MVVVVPWYQDDVVIGVLDSPVGHVRSTCPRSRPRSLVPSLVHRLLGGHLDVALIVRRVHLVVPEIQRPVAAHKLSRGDIESSSGVCGISGCALVERTGNEVVLADRDGLPRHIIARVDASRRVLHLDVIAVLVVKIVLGRVIQPLPVTVRHCHKEGRVSRSVVRVRLDGWVVIPHGSLKQMRGYGLL